MSDMDDKLWVSESSPCPTDIGSRPVPVLFMLVTLWPSFLISWGEYVTNVNLNPAPAQREIDTTTG